jgi:hypothetical protein
MNINELNWNPHPAGLGGNHALIWFSNGYGASVICGSVFYSNGVDTYEIAVLRGNSETWDIDYTTPITSDVLGHLSAREITSTLTLIEELPDG